MSTNRSKDRSSLCSFTFVDGRHCRTSECGGLVYLASCSGGSSDPPARGRERLGGVKLRVRKADVDSAASLLGQGIPGKFERQASSLTIPFVCPRVRRAAVRVRLWRSFYGVGTKRKKVVPELPPSETTSPTAKKENHRENHRQDRNFLCSRRSFSIGGARARKHGSTCASRPRIQFAGGFLGRFVLARQLSGIVRHYHHRLDRCLWACRPCRGGRHNYI